MKLAIIIGVLIAVFAVIVIVAGIIAITGASEEMYREFDDRDQAEYIRKWKAKKDAKKRK